MYTHTYTVPASLHVIPGSPYALARFGAERPDRKRPDMTRRKGGTVDLVADVDARLARIEQMFADGASVGDVVRELAKSGIGEAQTRRDVAAVEKRWLKDGTSRERQMLLNAFHRSIRQGQYGGALTAAARMLRSGPVDGQRAVKHFARAGRCPKGDVERGAWAHNVACLALEAVIRDPRIPDGERKNDIDRFCRTIASLAQYCEMYDALQRIKREQTQESAAADDELEPVNAAESKSLRANPH